MECGSVVFCTLIDNDICHHSGQKVESMTDNTEPFFFTTIIQHQRAC